MIQRINQVVTALQNQVVTTNSNTTTGNSAISGTFTAGGLVSNTGTIQSFSSANSVITDLTATTGNVVTLSSNTITANTGTFKTLGANTFTANTATIANLTVNTSVSGNTSANNATFISLVFDTGNANVLNANTLSANTLSANTGTIKILGANTITANTATIVSLSSSNVAITGGSIIGITDLAIAEGGTGASTATAALANLGGNNANNITLGTLSDSRLPTTLSAKTISTSLTTPQVNLTGGGGTSFIGGGNGDGASYSLYNIKISGWWGMGLVDGSTGNTKGFFDFRTGFFDVAGGYRVNGTNVVLNNGGQASISITGSASGIRQGGGAGTPSMIFNWSGQSGQPNWMWGGTDGVNMYVYNPSNFSVNYANSAGFAGTPATNNNSTSIATTAYVQNQVFSSGQITPTVGGAASVAHGFGQIPRYSVAIAKCVGAEFNYAVGDEIMMTTTDTVVGSTTNVGSGAIVAADGGSLIVRFGSNQFFSTLNKGTGVPCNLTFANWRVYLRAWL
jgi:hypothetical protein